MNYVFISPNFPDNFYHFCVRLNQKGVNVLGLANEPYENLRPELKSALTDYYKVDDLHHYDDLIRALGYFTHHYGKIDRLDSMNDYWFEIEAGLRSDFNIFGFNRDVIGKIKYKSQMKEVYRIAGVDVVKGIVATNRDEVLRFGKEVGYPLVIKPDNGVGASNTYKVISEEDLSGILDRFPHLNFFVEEYVEGDIYSFDGVVNRDGNPVFYTVNRFSQGIMETVNQDLDLYYYSLRDIPDDIYQAGMKTLKGFEIRERFFHLEFFKTVDNRIIGLEVNMRPPGGWTLDMFNYANDFDIYSEWVNLVTNNQFTHRVRLKDKRKCYCCYIGRKDNKAYKNSHDEIMKRFGKSIVYHNRMAEAFARVLGNTGYIVKTEDYDLMMEIIQYTQAYS